MARHHSDWLEAFLNYTQYSEAPRRVFFWVGVAAIAGALRRRVWIEMGYFKWYANFFIFIVGDPGVIKKSTTADVGMRLLRKVPNIKFGPDAVTWQSLVTSLAESGEVTTLPSGEMLDMSAVTIVSREAGNLLNPQDREMVDLLVSLWDGADTFEKRTKMSGNDLIKAPWVHIIACTTPSWIAGHVPEYMVGGGFTSRCVFVYGDKPDKLVAYPTETIPRDWMEQEAEKLVEDLVHISQMGGEYVLTPAAIDWGTQWYELHHKEKPANLDDMRFGGYLARKQTHIHKLAMVMAASRKDEMTIDEEDLVSAERMVTDLELDMPKVFARIGKSAQANVADRFIEFVRRKQAVSYQEAYQWIHGYFPAGLDMENLVAGAVKAGLIMTKGEGMATVLVARRAES